MQPRYNRNKGSIYSATLLYLYLGLSLFLCLIKVEAPTEKIIITFLYIPVDKWLHFLLFIPLPICIFLYRRFRDIYIEPAKFFCENLSYGVAFGLLIEVLQGSITSYRGENMYDLLADAIGTLAGLLIVFIFGTTIEKIVRKIIRI